MSNENSLFNDHSNNHSTDEESLLCGNNFNDEIVSILKSLDGGAYSEGLKDNQKDNNLANRRLTFAKICWELMVKSSEKSIKSLQVMTTMENMSDACKHELSTTKINLTLANDKFYSNNIYSFSIGDKVKITMTNPEEYTPLHKRIDSFNDQLTAKMSTLTLMIIDIEQILVEDIYKTQKAMSELQNDSTPTIDKDNISDSIENIIGSMSKLKNFEPINRNAEIYKVAVMDKDVDPDVKIKIEECSFLDCQLIDENLYDEFNNARLYNFYDAIEMFHINMADWLTRYINKSQPTTQKTMFVIAIKSFSVGMGDNIHSPVSPGKVVAMLSLQEERFIKAHFAMKKAVENVVLTVNKLDLD